MATHLAHRQPGLRRVAAIGFHATRIKGVSAVELRVLELPPSLNRRMGYWLEKRTAQSWYILQLFKSMSSLKEEKLI
jgi:hypothetical protein